SGAVFVRVGKTGSAVGVVAETVNGWVVHARFNLVLGQCHAKAVPVDIGVQPHREQMVRKLPVIERPKHRGHSADSVEGLLICRVDGCTLPIVIVKSAEPGDSQRRPSFVDPIVEAEALDVVSTWSAAPMMELRHAPRT